MTLTVCACDPGVSLNVAIYAGPEFTPALFPDMGTKRKDSAGRDRTDPDVAAFLDTLDQYRPTIGGVEAVGPMRGKVGADGQGGRQGVASTARFMKAAGLVEGVYYGRGMRVVLIAPQTWRKAFRLPAGKDQSRVACTRMFPSMAASFKRIQDHNIADALLMAVWVWCRETGSRFPV